MCYNGQMSIKIGNLEHKTVGFNHSGNIWDSGIEVRESSWVTDIFIINQSQRQKNTGQEG